MLKIIKEKEIILYLILSILFAITIQQFPFFKGNSLHLLHAIKSLILINYKMIGLQIKQIIYQFSYIK